MKSLYNKVYKNYQVNVGVPFQVKIPHNIRQVPLTPVGGNHETDGGSVAMPDSEDILAAAKEEADLILREAQLEAERIIEDTKQELESLRAVIEEEARKEGYEEGIAQARKQYEDLIKEAEIIKEHAKTEYGEALAGMESNILEMILDISRKVIGLELSASKEAMLEMVKQAFEKCTKSEGITVRVSPEDAVYLEEHKEHLHVSGISEFIIKADSSMKPGDCIIDTSFGSLDAGVETKLRKIEEAFRQALHR